VELVGKIGGCSGRGECEYLLVVGLVFLVDATAGEQWLE
jgi:hypothetical protein